MKKLIALIGAVAMAFGLYAEGEATTPNSTATSFEADDAGVTASNTWSAATAGWTYPDAEEFTLGAQDADELTAADVYGTGRQRRNDEFLGKNQNDNFLKLETGNKVLSHGIAAGQVYVDQLVKFTGFEEAQTNIEGKVAVWMTAIEQEGTPAVGEEGQDGYVPASTDYIAADTNLYVSVGNADGDLVNVKLTGNYEPGKWYRLTIKSVGNVIGVGADQQLGFQIFINGVEAAIVADDRAYNDNSDSFTANAKKLYDDGQLFTAMGEFSALASVGYQGIGSVDDIIISEVAPDFDAAVAVTFAPPTGAEVTSVKDNKGNVYEYKGEAIKVAPGELEVTIVAAPGYFFYDKDGEKVYTLTETVTASADGEFEVKLDDGESCVAAAVQVVDANDATNLYAAAELAVELTGLKTGDTATVLQNCAITKGEEEEAVTLFSFTEGTTIEVPEANVWNVFIAKYTSEGVEGAGALFDNVGLLAGKTVNVAFDDPIDEENVCALYIFGAIAGDITADNKGIVYVDTDGIGGSTLAGTITAANISVGGNVTFSGNAKIVSSATDLNDFLDYFLADDAEVEVLGGDEGPWTAQIKGAPQETGFAIIIADADPVTTNYYETLDLAIEAAGTDDLPAVVTILADAELDAATMVEKNVTIDLNGKTLTYTGSTDGIYFKGTQANVLNCTVKNGSIVMAGAYTPDWVGAITFEDAAGLVKDVTVNAGEAKYGVTACCDDDSNTCDATVVCENVDVTGKGLLFYCESEKMTLDADCSAEKTGNSSYGADYDNAVAASWLGELTISGGEYTAAEGNGNVLGTMTSPATITITGGDFEGAFNIMDVAAKYVDGANKLGDGQHHIAISGGTFTVDPSAYVVEGYAATLDPDTGKYSVAKSEEPEVAVAIVKLAGGEFGDPMPLHDALEAGKAAGSVVELIADVDLAGKAWEPIDDFKGSFNGAGFTISNLNIVAESGNYQGLFAKAGGDKDNKVWISNLTFENVTIDAPNSQYVGTIVGGSNGNTSMAFTNVTVCGSINIVGYKYVGGLMGHIYSADAYKCVIDGGNKATSFIGQANTKTDEGQVGGITGMSCDGCDLQIFGCSVKNISMFGNERMGGIAGRFHTGAMAINCLVENVDIVNTADTSSNGAIVGVLLGQNAVMNCTANNVTINGENFGTTYVGTSEKSAIGTGFEGDNFTFDSAKFNLTAGTFAADDATGLKNITDQIAVGYEAVENQDGTYTIQLKKVVATFKVDDADYAVVTNDWGTAPTAPADPVKAGYTFTGWNPEVGVIKADTTYTATFAEVKVTSITLDVTSTNVAPAAVFTLTATVEPATGALDPSIAWTTSDDAVATVVDGVVTAVAEGTATITATNAASGVFATCTVTVKAAEEPVVPPEQGEIKPNPSTGGYEVTPEAGVTEIDVSNLGDKGTYVSIPPQVNTVKGVPAEKIKVLVPTGTPGSSYNITEAFTKTGDATTGVKLELNPEATVKIDEETIAVKPTIGENVEASEVDITAGEIAVQAIPGLTYELVRSTKLGDAKTEQIADTAKATATKVELTDKIDGEKPAAAFYQIKVEAK